MIELSYIRYLRVAVVSDETPSPNFRSLNIEFGFYRQTATVKMNWTRAMSAYTVFQKTSTHIIGYKLRNSCPILIIFDIKIPYIILDRMTA